MQFAFPRRNKPRIWSAIDQHAPESAGAGALWHSLSEHASAPPRRATSLWKALTDRTTMALYCPHAIGEAFEETIVEGDQTFAVIRSPNGTYRRLTPVERSVWDKMDGTQSIEQLGYYVYAELHQIMPLGQFVTTLRQEGFLQDPPCNLYQQLKQADEQRSAEGWSRRILHLLTDKTWNLPYVDRVYSAIYRWGGWLLFTPVFFVLWLLIALAGSAAFLSLVFAGQSNALLSVQNGVTSDLIILWLAIGLSFILHESGHALMTKHFGRTLLSGGVMLYFGMPACFVNTSDIWRSPRRARLLVSAAGPMSDMLFGSLAALWVWWQPGHPLNAVAYKIAFTSFVSILFNLNPLLTLDGYFMLIDWLRLPNLRQQALQFVRGPLWERLRQRPRAPLSNQERIFAWYGLLTVAYTVVAVVFAVQFWRKQLFAPTWALLFSQSLPQRLLGVALLLLVVVPLLVAAGLLLYSAVRFVLRWTIERGLGRRPTLLAGVAVLAAGTLALLGSRLPPELHATLAVLLWVLALGALVSLLPDYAGAALEPAIKSLAVATMLATLAALVRALAVYVQFDQWAVWGLWFDAVAFVFMVIAGFAMLMDMNLRDTPARELLASALVLMAAFGVGSVALYSALLRWHNPAVAIFAGAPAYFGAVALALFLPHLLSLRESRVVWAWLLLWCAALAETVSYVWSIQSVAATPGIVAAVPMLDTLAPALWAGAWLVHLALLRQIAFHEVEWSQNASISESERLAHAFSHCYAGCYQILRATYGSRRARALDDRMDVFAATANWDIALDRDTTRINASVRALPLAEQGARYAEVLRYTIDTICDLAGEPFARRAIQTAYDALPWQERETASRLCFPATPWAEALSKAFGDEQERRVRLLRQSNLLLACDDAELRALAEHTVPQAVGAGTVLAQAGTSAGGVWLIEAGEVLAIDPATRRQTELHSGDSFGSNEVLGEMPFAARYHASILSSMVFIPAEQFRATLQRHAARSDEVVAELATVRLLEEMPLFAALPRATLRLLAHLGKQQRFEPRNVIVRQGRPSGTFYVIKQGRAAVLVSDRAINDGKPRMVATLGPQEFFGEMELLRGTPPVASVAALSALLAIALPHDVVSSLVLQYGTAAQGMEQISSGRMLVLRQPSADSSTGSQAATAAP